MPTNWPTSLDSFTNPTGTDRLSSPSHSSQHANSNDAIEALEAYIGTNASQTTPTATQSFLVSSSSSASTWTTSPALVDDAYIGFGNTQTSPDARLGWNTTQTVDALYLGLSDGQNTFVIAENGDRAFDFAHGAATNPTLFIHSATQSTTQWLSLSHNQTNGVVATGAGAIIIDAPNGVQLQDASVSALTVTSNGTTATWTAAASDNIEIIPTTSGTLTLNAEGTTTQVVLQNRTITPGAAYQAVLIAPEFTAENFDHKAFRIDATQSGANSSVLEGMDFFLTKETAATTLGTINFIRFNAPVLSAGTVTNVNGLLIDDMSLAGATTSYGINLVSQTANATTTRAMLIQGTGVNNAIRLGSGLNMFAQSTEVLRITDSTNARGFDFTLTAASFQVIGTIIDNFHLAVGGTSEIIISSTNIDVVSNTLELNNFIQWDTGVAITAAGYQVTRDVDATNQLHFNVPTGASFEWSINDVARIVLAASTETHTQVAATTGAPVGLTFTGGAHTTLSASPGSFTDVNFNLNRTIQFTTGGGFDYFGFNISAPTIGATAATQTITSAGTLTIDGGPLAGTNVTIEETSAIQVIEWVSNADDAASGSFDVPGISNGFGTALSRSGLNVGGDTISLGNQTATLTDLSMITIGQATFTSTTNTRTVTNPVGLYIQGAPIAGTNVTFTNGPWSIWVGTGNSKFDGNIYINDTSNANMTTGLTVNQGAADNEIISLKSSDIAHGFTSVTETDTYALMRKVSGDNGGMEVITFTDSTTFTVNLNVDVRSRADLDTTKTTSGSGAIRFYVAQHNGANAIANVVADGNLMVITARSGGADATRFIFDAEGSAHADVEWITFDTHDDIALLDTLDAKMSKRDAVTNAFGEVLKYNQDTLQEAGIVNFYDDGPRAMLNTTRLAMLHTGAIRQLYRRIAEQSKIIKQLEQKLLIAGI